MYLITIYHFPVIYSQHIALKVETEVRIIAV